MKFLTSSLVALCVAASLPTQSEAFTAVGRSPLSTGRSAFVPRKLSAKAPSNMAPVRPPNTSLSMSYSVGIVGATGAVGVEIRQCLEKRDFPVSELRIFGSSRSAGTEVETEKYGTVTAELFDVDKARECDVVFLAVSGDFALEHAKALSEGDGGAVVIDNSVSSMRKEEGNHFVLQGCHQTSQLTPPSTLSSLPFATTRIFHSLYQKSMESAQRVTSSLQTLTAPPPLGSWRFGLLLRPLVSRGSSCRPTKPQVERGNQVWMS